MALKVALISGVTGQDGYYLAKYLIDLEYKVFGLVSGQHNFKISKLKVDLPELEILYGDLQDSHSLIRALESSNPDEIYNLAAISFVGVSWAQPEKVAEVTGLGVLKFLEAVRHFQNKSKKKIKFYQASSSEMFGKVKESPQNESTPFYPRSPYGVAKVFGHQITVNYRESFGIHSVSGILFNHESPRRGEEFVTRKVTKAVAAIKYKLQDKLILGNLSSKRDWGFAGDYVKGMHSMMQIDNPQDFVLATGKTHSIEDLCRIAFEIVGLNWEEFVEVDTNLLRPAEVDLLIGDYSKAEKLLGWKPDVEFAELIEMMVTNDLDLIKGKS
jgi:GDPmannose 4,6-dehydratase